MDVSDAISSRVSCRSYIPRDVSDEDIELIIEAARKAPSGHNVQPWRFVILKGTECGKLKGVATQKFVWTAPCVIVCCADLSGYESTSRLDDPPLTKAVRDLSIASAFMVLQAEELGLGSCYVGWIDKNLINEKLGIPKEMIVPFVITLGYPKTKGKQSSRLPLKKLLI
jgi:nitroreductase